MEKILSDELIEKIEAIMPHGSGINYEYEIRGTKDRFYVYNAYDYINEYWKIKLKRF